MTTTLAPGLALRHLDAPHFLATKFEAFNNRGGRDVYASHDLEDIITVIDGRAELADELAQTTPSVRTHVVLETRAPLAHPEMRNALPGIVTQAIRVGVVLDRLQRIAALAS